EARRQVEDARQEVRTAVASLTSLLAEDDDAVPVLTQATESLDAAQLKSTTAALVARAETGLSAARQRQTEAQRAERAAQKALDAERELEQRVRRRTALLAEQQLLTDREAAVTTLATELAAGRRAAVAAGALRAQEAARSAVAEAEHVLEQVCSAAAAGVDADLSELELPAVKGVVEQLTGERGGLGELVEL